MREEYEIYDGVTVVIEPNAHYYRCHFFDCQFVGEGPAKIEECGIYFHGLFSPYFQGTERVTFDSCVLHELDHRGRINTGSGYKERRHDDYQ